MNKKSFIRVGKVLMFLLSIGLVLSCDNGSTAKASSEKALIEITINGKTPDKIPEPISKGELEAGSFTDPKYTGTIYLDDETQLTNAAATVKISSGAKASFGLASGFDAPASFSSNTTLSTITPGQALYVKVTASNGSVNYYRFTILLISSDSSLSMLTVAGISATLGTPGITWQGANTASGTISISNSKKDDAKVIGTPSNPKATVEYALMTSAVQPTGFSDTVDIYTFIDGNIFWVKVTAENGQAFSYYRFNVQVGKDATLSGVTVGTAKAELGTSKLTNWSNFTASQLGSCQAEEKMPATGFTVTITPNDEEATVVYAYIGTNEYTSTAAPTTFNGTSPHIFPVPPYQEDLAIRVTSANGAVTRYYRIRFITKSWATVYKGTPKIVNPDNAGDKQYIDPIWDAEDWLDVSRFNTAESYKAWFATSQGRHTSARAKALWDNDGFWVYWDIDFYDYVDDEGNKIRTATVSTSDNTWNCDSVELFINERVQSQKTGNYGCQYRAGVPSDAGVIWLSGTGGNMPDGVNPLTVFQNKNKVNSWIKKEAGKETGYVVIMQAPWIFNAGTAQTQADAVFGADGKVKEGAEVGVELQVNACALKGDRDAILTWNGVTSQAYQNVKSYGIVTLKTAKEP